MYPLFHESRTFGVEVEYVPCVNAVFKRKMERAGIQVTQEGYHHETRDYWRITTDGSVGYRTGTGRTRTGFELVSPKLSGIEGMNQVHTVVRLLKEAGATTNASCGLHVHHDISDLRFPMIQALVRRYAKSQDLMDGVAGREAGRFCHRLTQHFAYGSPDEDPMTRLFTALDECQNVKQIRELVRQCHCRDERRCDCYGRYCVLNFGNYFRTGTVEFRQHRGSVNADSVCAWIVLTQAMIQQSLNTRPNMMKPTPYDRATFLKHLNWPGWCEVDPRVLTHVKTRLDARAALTAAQTPATRPQTVREAILAGAAG